MFCFNISRTKKKKRKNETKKDKYMKWNRNYYYYYHHKRRLTWNYTQYKRGEEKQLSFDVLKIEL